MKTRYLMLVLPLLAGLALLPSCTAKKETTDDTSSADAGSGGDAASTAVAASLKKADLADGEEDKTVSKCLMCRLGMDGSADHEATLDGYSLNMCSAECKKSFESDPEKALASVE